MKKSAIIVLTGVLMLAFFMTNIGTASAFRITPPSLPDPTATFMQGNPQFKAEVIPTTQLAGLDSLANSMLVPAGFAKGEKQFEGKALQISGLSKTTVNLCFAFKGKSSGWGGQVGYWNGSFWDLLATTVTPAQESSLSWACAQASANGQYAFIKWVVDASLLPKTTKAEKPYCDFAPYMFSPVPDSSPEGFDDHLILSDVNHYLFYSFDDLAGKSVKVTYVVSHPKGSTTFNGIDSNFVLINGTLQTTATPGRYLIETVAPLEIITYYVEDTIEYYLDFGDCGTTFIISSSQ